MRYLASGFSFSNRVGVEKLKISGEINKKLLRNPRIVLQLKLKLQAKGMFTGGENRLSPTEKENPVACVAGGLVGSKNY